MVDNHNQELDKPIVIERSNPSQEQPSVARKRGNLSTVAKHTFLVLLATVAWGFVAGVLWPDVGTIILAEMGASDAIAEIEAMSEKEIERSLTVWFYYIVGSPISVLVGFTAAAVLTKSNRVKHLLTVAFALWVVNSVQVLIGTRTVETHAFSLVVYSVAALLAVGLAYLVKKPSRAETEQTAG